MGWTCWEWEGVSDIQQNTNQDIQALISPSQANNSPLVEWTAFVLS